VRHSIVLHLKEFKNMKLIGKEHGVSWSTVLRVLQSLSSYVKPNFHHLPSVLMMDEFNATSRIKGKMAFVYADGITGAIQDILPFRTADQLIAYFYKFPLKVRKQVQFVCMDMNAGYDKVVQAVFPSAQIVTDRFHIIQHINRAFNQVRIQMMKHLKGHIPSQAKDKRKLKKYWKLLLKQPSSIDYTELRQYPLFRGKWLTESEVLDYLLSIDPRLRETYQVYYELMDAYEKKDTDTFFDVIEMLSKSLDLSFKNSLRYLRNKQKKGVTNAFEQSYSNGKLEGKNNVIKVIKRQAFGFRSFQNLKLRILLQQGLIEVR
jgi:transposase